MVKRILWWPRNDSWNATAAARMLQKIEDLPEGTDPKQGWLRSMPTSIEISGEQFPGSTPVWFWEER